MATRNDVKMWDGLGVNSLYSARKFLIARLTSHHRNATDKHKIICRECTDYS
jgi:hypothetical protein